MPSEKQFFTIFMKTKTYLRNYSLVDWFIFLFLSTHTFQIASNNINRQKVKNFGGILWIFAIFFIFNYKNRCSANQNNAKWNELQSISLNNFISTSDFVTKAQRKPYISSTKILKKKKSVWNVSFHWYRGRFDYFTWNIVAALLGRYFVLVLESCTLVAFLWICVR